MQESKEDTTDRDIKNKKELKDDSLISTRNDTTEALDAMELNESIFQQLHLSEPKVESFVSQLKEGFKNAPGNQEFLQNLPKSEPLKPGNNENECVRDSNYYSNVRKSANTNRSVKTPTLHAPECEAEADCNTYKKKIPSSDKRKNMEIECGGRVLRSAKMKYAESVNLNHSNEKINTQETKDSTGKNLTHLITANWNKGQDKENIQNTEDRIEKNIVTSKMSHNNIEHVKGFRTSQENNQKDLFLTSASCNSFPKVPTPLCLPAHSLAMESSKKICNLVPDIGVSGQLHDSRTNSETKSCLNFRFSVKELQKEQDEVPTNFHSPQIIGKKTENIVIKSPLNSTDSQNILSTQEKMELSSWGLPDAVLKVI